MRDILVIGSLNMDMVVRAPHIPAAGETVSGRFAANIPGGKGANQACAAARSGADTAMLGLVGRDAFGDALTESLRQAHVDTALIGRSDEHTGQALICVSDQGSNAIVILPGANGACGEDVIRRHEADIAGSRTVMLQMEIPEEAVWTAVRLGKKHGCRVILNPAPVRGPLPPDILPLIDWLTPNEIELSVLTGLPVGSPEDAAAAARRLTAQGVRAVLATLGSQGALLVTGDETRFFPAEKVTAVDTTAAGDTFSGAFAARLSECGDPARAIAFANAAAGISVTRSGAQTSIPDRAEVDLYMARQSVGREEPDADKT